MFLMPAKIRISFNNRRFLELKPAFLADETALLCVKNHRFLRGNALNEAVFSSCRFSKRWFYDMLTWQIMVFAFLFRQKSRR